MTCLMVALGGALGSVLRFWLGGFVGEKAGAMFWGTLAVNVLGCFLIGIASSFEKAGPSDFTKHFVMVGIMGGYVRWSGLVEDPSQAITVIERISGRQLDPFGREVMLMVHELR